MFLYSLSKVGTVFIGEHCIFNKSLTKRIWALKRLFKKFFLKLLPDKALSKPVFVLRLYECRASKCYDS